MQQPRRVLFICTGNSARSQMAEGLLRVLGRGAFEVHSAGLEPKGINVLAVVAMGEIGIAISRQSSKHLSTYYDQLFDSVISVCDNARDQCPVFPGNPEHLHWSYPDPAAVRGTTAEKLRAFRSVRDGLRDQIKAWISSQP